ncbi:MAG: energy transducer TonB [Muribaculaceae bacterium]|nr:energy transducer TonB [Muribaculaceae bacterium]
MSLKYRPSQFDCINLSLFIALVCMLVPAFASAQTCRVSSGTSADGCQTFREVFEYDFVDEKPVFPGGAEALLGYINKNRRYPHEAYEKGLTGRVVCSFVVNADGDISNLRVIKGSHKSLNLEAMRLLAEMPAWIPGKLNGRNVPVRVVYSVPFRK